MLSLNEKEGNKTDHEYGQYLARVQQKFNSSIENGEKLFTTDSSGLWEAYLSGFPLYERQHHNCHSCRHFIERFGGLVTIDESGATKSAIWDENDPYLDYSDSVKAMLKIIKSQAVAGVFVSSEKNYGLAITGIWQHLNITAPSNLVYRNVLKTAYQESAEKLEDFKNICRALMEFKKEHVGVAVQLLKSDALYRSEKLLGQGEFLLNLHNSRDAAKGKNKSNVVWRAIAFAPAGFCHPRSSMIGTLLEDIAEGLSFDEVSRKFAAKMHPLQYQRPQAAPSAGAIENAEKIFSKMGAERSLLRRFARIDEVKSIWTPKVKEVSGSGIFGHLNKKDSLEALTTNAKAMTWEKFNREILPNAEKMQILTVQSGAYTSLLTCVDIEAPAILQWDLEENRNPFSWYFWHGGATASQFGLPSREWKDVNAICLKPNMWNGGFEHQGIGALFIIDGAAETRISGSALFPETLKNEFHAVRSVIEAYSKNATIHDKDNQSAAGLMFQGNQDINVRALVNGVYLHVKLDRWN